MPLYGQLWKSSFGKAALATAALSAFLLLLGAPSAKADQGDSGHRRIAYVEFRLHESIVYFGYYSPQANYWRHERQEAFEQLERYRRREWREHERREHRRDEHGRRYYRDRARDDDGSFAFICQGKWKRGAATQSRRPVFVLQQGRKLARIHQLFLGKDGFESPRFILIVQHHDRHDS